MVMPGISTHARVRMQQRGINECVLERLIEFGEARHDHRGAEIVFFDKAARRRLAARLGTRALKSMERQMKRSKKIEFKSDVSIPEGGTLVVATSSKSNPNRPTILLAISAAAPGAAPTQPPDVANKPGATGSSGVAAPR